MWMNSPQNPALEFHQHDTRPTHELNDVVTLEDVRKAKQSKANLDAQDVRTHQAAAWSPKKQKGYNSLDGAHAQPITKGVTFIPTAAARQQLGSEKPALLQRMDDTVARCRAARDNRNYRLNSLGVFEGDENEVRARSMLRVQVHKDLSTTSMRLPDTHKEVKTEKPNESVEANLERMYNKVLHSLPDPSQKPPPSMSRDLNNKYRASVGGRPLSPGTSVVNWAIGALDSLSECSAVLEMVPTNSTHRLGRGNPHLAGSVLSVKNTPSPSRQVTTTNTHIPPTNTSKELERGHLSGESPSSKSLGGANRLAFPQQTSQLLTPTLSTIKESRGDASIAVDKKRGSKTNQKLCLRLPGPLKCSPFASSKGAGSGMAPRRPSNLFRCKPGTDPPIYGRRSGAQASSCQPPANGRSRIVIKSKRWDLEGLPMAGELAQAHLARLEMATGDNMSRYYKQVAEAQTESLLRSGLHEGVLHMTPAHLHEALMQQLKAERMEEEEESLRQSRMAGGTLNPSCARNLAQDALEHCAMMTEDLDVLRASLPKPLPKSGRRRKPSIPMAPGSSKNVLSPGSNSSDMLASKLADVGGKAHRPSETWELEGEGSKFIAGADRDVLAEDPPGFIPGLSFLKQREQKRGLELLRPPVSQFETDEEGNEEADVTEEELVRDAPTEGKGASQDDKEQPLQDSKRELQENQTFSTKRLNKFKMMLDDAATVTVDEVSKQMPALPTIPAMTSTPMHIQARLERVWDLLHLPLPSRLDAVLEYTKHSRLLQFEHALKVWEQAAVAVLQREGMVDTLLLVQKGVEEGSVGYLTISALERQCVRLVQVTSYLEQLKARLRDQYCVELTYHGQPYPGDNQLSSDQLLEFMEWLKDSSDSVICLS